MTGGSHGDADTQGKNVVHYRRVARHWSQRLACAQHATAANIAVAAKTAEINPKLAGTIYTAAKAIEEAGGNALPITVDVRDEAAVRRALDETAQHFGGIDIVVNNASAISLTDSQATDMKCFDLMHQINARGTFMVSKFAAPYLFKAENPHLLMLSRHST